ncbi:class II fructose-bisphosphate aldolase [Actinomycetaceae bacterium L2_0104]
MKRAPLFGTNVAAAMVAVGKAASTPVVLHLDHITKPELAMRAIELGFSSVMYDGSKLDFIANVDTTKTVADWGRKSGVWVEAELGEVGGKDGAHAPGVRTDPQEAARFAADTGVDSLAVAVGSSHAMTTQTAELDIDLITRIHRAVPVPLVLHGSSGVPDSSIAAATRAGMWKINIGTALNIAFTGEVRAWLTTNDGVDPRKYLVPAREAVANTVAHFLRVVAGEVD